ncbi:transcriptional regulator [Acinetobacter baumannii]
MTIDLLKLRKKIDKYRQSSGLTAENSLLIQQSIASSWQRSVVAKIPHDRLAAPLTHVINTNCNNRLKQALDYCSEDLKYIAEQSSLVFAVGNVNSTIIWTAANRQLRRNAEQVHVVEGGQWREELVGTNAMHLALKTNQSCCIFANEHFMTSIHDWACYATPIIDPITNNQIGAINISTKWNRHHSLGILVAERCAETIQKALSQYDQPKLYLKILTQTELRVNGKTLNLSPRQIEILCIIALSPNGIPLDILQDALYGDRKVSINTLKTEIFHLREMLKGCISTNPYRFLVEIEGDFLQVEQYLNAGYIEAALNLYTGEFLPKTESPFLCCWRDALEFRLSDAIFNFTEPSVLFKYLSKFPEAIDVIERLQELLPSNHPAIKKLIERSN